MEKNSTEKGSVPFVNRSRRYKVNYFDALGELFKEINNDTLGSVSECHQNEFKDRREDISEK